MEFRNLVTRETSELVGRLVNGVAEQSARDLQALKHALDLVTEAVDSALATDRCPDYHDDVAKLAERLQAESAAAVHAATAQIQAAGAQLERETQQTIDALRRQATDATAEVKAVTAQREELMAQLRTSADQVAELKRANKELQAARGELETKVQSVGGATNALRHRAETAERETARVRAEAELAAQASVRAARALEEADARWAKRLAEKADTVGQQATSFLSTSLDRLLATYLSVASSNTVDDMLTALVEALAVQFSRVALFRVQSNHLEGVRQVGFDLRADISQVLVPRTMDALVTEAVSSARIETRSAADGPVVTGMPFGGTPEYALALPLVIDGQAIAVVYADDADQPHREFTAPEIRLKYAQLLQCHALPLLTRVADRAKALSEMNEYADLLLRELEQTHAADAQLDDDERLGQLRDNIDYARQLYSQRAAAEGPHVVALFEQQLMSAAELHANTQFSRDVAAVVGVHEDAPAGEAAGAKG
ncbi:MAG: hypothetical protein ACM3NQ_11400 [Bacteroidales bacterium]